MAVCDFIRKLNFLVLAQDVINFSPSALSVTFVGAEFGGIVIFFGFTNRRSQSIPILFISEFVGIGWVAEEPFIQVILVVTRTDEI